MTDSTLLNFALDAFLHQPAGGKGSHDYEEFVVACVHIVGGGSVSPSVFVLRETETSVAAHAGMAALATEAGPHTHNVYSFSATVTGEAKKSEAVIQLYTCGTTQYHDLPVREALRKVSEVTLPLTSVARGVSAPMIILNAIDFTDVARASLTTRDARNLLEGLGADCVRGHVSVWVEGRPVPDRVYTFTEDDLDRAAARLVTGHADFFAYYLSPYLRAMSARQGLATIGLPEGKARSMHPFMEQTYENAVSMHAACTVLPSGTMFPSVESLAVVRPGRFRRSTMDTAIMVALSLMPPIFKDGPQMSLFDSRSSKTALSFISRLSNAIKARDADVMMRFVLVLTKAACVLANMAAYDSDVRTTQRASTPSELVNGMRMVGGIGESADCDGQARLAVEALLSMRQISESKSPLLCVLGGRVLRMTYTPVLATAGAEGAQMRSEAAGSSSPLHTGFSKSFVEYASLVSHAPAFLVRNDVLLSALVEGDPAIADGFYTTCDHDPSIDLTLFPPMFLAEGTAATHPCMYDPEVLARVADGDRAAVSGTGPGSMYSQLVQESLGRENEDLSARSLRAASWLSIHGRPRFGSGMATFVRVVTQFGLPPFPYVSEDGSTRVASSFYLCQRRGDRTTAGVATPDIVFPDGSTSLVLKANRTFSSEQEFESFRREPMRVDGLPVFSRLIGHEGNMALADLNTTIVEGEANDVEKATLSLYGVLEASCGAEEHSNSTGALMFSETARVCASRLASLQQAVRDSGMTLVLASKTRSASQSFAVSTGFLYNLRDSVIEDLVHAFRSKYSVVSVTMVVYTSSGMAEVFIQPAPTTK